jgi:RHS repeat-associated protein
LYSFTGKERDQETGNDYFGARYYNSNVGRWLSPDWSAKVEPVPYAKLGDPQSLNLYSYVYNSPMSRFDSDGHVVHFADEKLQAQFNNMASQSQTLRDEYNAANDPNAQVDVEVLERGLKVNAQKSQGDTTVHGEDENGVTKIEIWVDPYRSSDAEVEHEWGHEQQARILGGREFIRIGNEGMTNIPNPTMMIDHWRRVLLSSKSKLTRTDAPIRSHPKKRNRRRKLVRGPETRAFAKQSTPLARSPLAKASRSTKKV